MPCFSYVVVQRQPFHFLCFHRILQLTKEVLLNGARLPISPFDLLFEHDMHCQQVIVLSVDCSRRRLTPAGFMLFLAFGFTSQELSLTSQLWHFPISRLSLCSCHLLLIYCFPSLHSFLFYFSSTLVSLSLQPHLTPYMLLHFALCHRVLLRVVVCDVSHEALFTVSCVWHKYDTQKERFIDSRAFKWLSRIHLKAQMK